MTYLDDRELRRKMSLAFGQRGFRENDHNNSKIILKIIELEKNVLNCWI